jgi:segregation and condensation protein A
VAYEVKLEVFEGPIDLLLNLITRQRVDIYDVSLAAITDEYLAALHRMEHLDLESATGFLVVAATLLELKSARLLPASRWDEASAGLLEERDLLLARLVECATYREAGMWLAGALKAGESYHPRRAGLEPHYEGLAPDVLAAVGAIDVAEAGARLLAPRPTLVLDTSHLAPIKASVKDAIVEVADRLESGGRLSFEDLCAGRGERIQVVVRFLALLELFKAGAVELAQAHRFGDIVVTWTGEVDRGEVVAEAEEYTLEVGS